MQGDGKFVVYNSSTGQALWATYTSTPGSYIIMQGDGNLVIYTPTGTATWSSGTWGNWGVYAVMQGDSNFVLYGPSGRALWDYGSGLLGTSVSTLYTGQTLNTGQELWSPRTAPYELVMQGDGNLVLYQGGTALWATYSSGSANYLVMQGDGNLVVYNSSGVAQWDSGTSGSGFYAEVQSDSNFVIYSSSNLAEWDYGNGLAKFSGGGSSGPTATETNEVNWAISKINSTVYGELCLGFVTDAYSAAGLNISALMNFSPINGNTYPQEVWDAGFKSGTTGGSGTTPPYGALVFYNASGAGASDPSNDSHVTIMGSGGEMISTNDVVGPNAVHYETMMQVSDAHPYNTYVGWWLPDGS